jgi:hypothetical protein
VLYQFADPKLEKLSAAEDPGADGSRERGQGEGEAAGDSECRVVKGAEGVNAGCLHREWTPGSNQRKVLIQRLPDGGSMQERTG